MGVFTLKYSGSLMLLPKGRGEDKREDSTADCLWKIVIIFHTAYYEIRTDAKAASASRSFAAHKTHCPPDESLVDWIKPTV